MNEDSSARKINRSNSAHSNRSTSPHIIPDGSAQETSPDNSVKTAPGTSPDDSKETNNPDSDACGKVCSGCPDDSENVEVASAQKADPVGSEQKSNDNILAQTSDLDSAEQKLNHDVTAQKPDLVIAEQKINQDITAEKADLVIAEQEINQGITAEKAELDNAELRKEQDNSALTTDADKTEQRIKRDNAAQTYNLNILAQNMNLERWMSELPDPLKKLPIIHLAIPGSHDSMTYSITRTSKLAPDAEPALKQLYPLFRGTILRWTITQTLDAWQQLLIGIRYFDLRLATKTGSNAFFYTHGLYADEITQALLQVKEFVDTHPGEVVILDFQHFYGFTDQDHQRLVLYLLNMFRNQLVPRSQDLYGYTLDSLNRRKQQIIIVYRNQAAAFATGEFWSREMMPTPWPQQEKASGLIQYLKNITRSPAMGFIHQAVLTPTPSFILLRWISSLRAKCAIPVIKDVLPVIARDFTPGPPRGRSDTHTAPVNVVMADYVEIDDNVFPRTIIQLNFKLLNQLDGPKFPVFNK